MSSKQKVMPTLRDAGVIAVFRTDNHGNPVGAAQALCEGSVRLIEITMTLREARGSK